MSTSQKRTNILSLHNDGFDIARGRFEFEYTIPFLGEENDRARVIRLQLSNSKVVCYDEDKVSSSLGRFILIDSYYDPISNTLTPFAVGDSSMEPIWRVYTEDKIVASVQKICDGVVDLLDIAGAYKQFSEDREPLRGITIENML